MKINRIGNSIFRIYTKLRTGKLTRDLSKDELPLHSELFSADQMEQYGKVLAGTHHLKPNHHKEQLLARLADNEKQLLQVHNLLTEDIKDNRRISIAGEWLLDNFYLIEEQIRTARRHLPEGYSRELPHLLKGPSAGLPRVYDIALETIAHGDGRVDPENLSRFVASYQKVTPLKLGEIWAIPIMLRLALLENLRRVSGRIVSNRINRGIAEYWSKQMIDVATKDPKNLILTIADMARSSPPMVSSFVAELARTLQGQGQALALALTWMEQQLSETSQTINQLVQIENQKQAANQVTISNSIGSLRLLSVINWRDFVEKMSLVEQTLQTDPGGIYSQMDFSTRDHYRHVIEKIAKNSGKTEIEVAIQVIELARNAGGKEGDTRTGHIGFYLIDSGLPQLQKLVKMRSKSENRISSHFAFTLYSGAIVLLTMVLAGYLTARTGSGKWSLTVIPLGLLWLLCAGHLAVSLVNWLSTLLSRPQLLPRMDFSKGIPAEFSTLVIVPTMLTSATGIEAMVEALEVRFLANQGNHLYFGLLTDYGDAATETQLQDAPLLELVRGRIDELNQKYPSNQGNIFYLFQRRRQWNQSEGIWMGYERKRGKLADLNGLLRGKCKDKFSLIVGDLAILQEIKYVITLDSDTQLARDSAWQFAAVMAHPLNHPLYDQKKMRIVAGYGILQPRVSMNLSGSNRTCYAYLNASEYGIDPYTKAISDVYQDLFGEGSFIGKGIYDVDAFELATCGRLPENRILSHDLLEGCYVRSGLLSDVQLYEVYPSGYSADVSRRHRWIRGDWQIASWLLPSVPGPAGSRLKNPLSLLSRWKIADNLRRSLTAAALTLMLILSWTVLPAMMFSTLTIIAIIYLPSLLSSVLTLLRKSGDVTISQHLAKSLSDAGLSCIQATFTLICLPYEAYFSLDAILRTLWRIFFSHKHLLEWNLAGSQNRKKGTGITDSCRAMWLAPLLAVAMALTLALTVPGTLLIAGPILFLWFTSPIVTWWVSRPLTRSQVKLTEAQNVFLHKKSREIWSFFETFVGAEDNWLPPDNYQEYPVGVIAHRTSPTNLGLALLANLSALDFGYISAGKFLDRCGKTLNTMAELEHYRGHFYNWYDTQTLKPLPPLYISTVDSGNLAGHLMTLLPGLSAISDRKILDLSLFAGLKDTLGLITDAAATMDIYDPGALTQLQLEFDSAFKSNPDTLTNWRNCLERMAKPAMALLAGLRVPDDDPQNLLKYWTAAFADQCQEALAEIQQLTPWVILPDDWKNVVSFPALAAIPTLRELAELDIELLMPSTGPPQASNSDQTAKKLAFRNIIAQAIDQARARMLEINKQARQCETFSQMEYNFLYDTTRHLLAIGYNVSEGKLDSGFYDLLASEARLTNFVAIAQGQLPQECWFALGRLLTSAGGEPILLSWSGSMFEYLMPLLIMPNYDHTLLDQTCKAVVVRQIKYAKNYSVPWGISESGYNTIDGHHNYQYRAFGVPGLGLKRGLTEDLVIAPYASALALMIAPEEACLNLQRMATAGFTGRYGFYEAIDYTPARLPRGRSNAIIRSFMAHHQGMSLLSLAHLLLNRPMQKRFKSNPQFQAAMLLLQERVPKATESYMHTSMLSETSTPVAVSETPMRIIKTPDTPRPEVQLLSNGRYHVMVTNAGSGYSRWHDLALTRWHEDCTCDNWGAFCYLRDVSSGEVWSTAFQPTLKKSKKFETIFSEGRAEFRNLYNEYETHTEIAVSPEDDIEIRRIQITNHARTRREIEVTSYAEVVLAPPITDDLHPVFSNLFVQTEILPEQRAILCSRRPRSHGSSSPCMLHTMDVHGAKTSGVFYETDRMKFIGRGNTTANPISIDSNAGAYAPKLSASEGSVLDPIVAIRYLIILEPQTTATINIVSGISQTREMAVALVEKYHDRRLADRVFDLAWTHSQVLLRQLNATYVDVQLYDKLAGSIIYANPALRTTPDVIKKNKRGQSGLWGHAISGDLPIVLLQIEDPANINLVRQMVQAHAYWRLKGLAADLVIWNEDKAGYRQILHEQIMALISAGVEVNVNNKLGGIFIRPADQIASEDRILIQTVARVIITDRHGTLAEQINGQNQTEMIIPPLNPTREERAKIQGVEKPLPRPDLIFYNGLGGFTSDGREYVITTAPGQLTPAPWVNVLANPHFGTVISESGLSYSWCKNAHEFRLTPWSNDPVSDSRGEVFYIRDEERGHFWSPTPLPCSSTTTYVTRHGFGYSVFEHTQRGIYSELWVYVALDASVKFSVLKVRNDSQRNRKLSATGYVQWVLGDLPAKSTMHVITEIDPETGALFARNPYNTEFRNQTAFFDVDDSLRTVTGDRTEFLGRNGTLANPAALRRKRLSGKVGATLDPCGAIQVSFELEPGQERQIVFKLGSGRDPAEARMLTNRFRGATAAAGVLNQVWQHWADTLGAVSVETPDKSLNMLANGWLIYQTLACRLWGRSATYQSGGAFGFRDQLQDTMALIYARPELMREHLLLCSSHQFVNGDVQHWWHPPIGRGVRTHCSDDYLWLALASCHYVQVTGDTGILDVSSHFIQGRLVNPDEDSYYDLPENSSESASFYQHCVCAIEYGLTKFGDLGLPLMGGGDWNDGMNLVGQQGKGQSVWLGFFFYEVLNRFAHLATNYGDEPFARRCLEQAALLQVNLEKHSWDGQWYRRAYFDDGSPLGSAQNTECQIDSIAQSWSVLSGAGDVHRTRTAMNSLDKRLISREHGLIKLLDPPFDRSEMDPGYIKGYVPGVRENGGQYTHAAIWATMAFARLGDNKLAWECFNLINPINHTKTPSQTEIYKVEPYVVAADVYAVAPHSGRGGWTWYTGSAAWMYRLIIESLLGLSVEADKLTINPCLPADWPEFKIHYRYRRSIYHITVKQLPFGTPGTLSVDGNSQKTNTITMYDDQKEHWVHKESPRTQPTVSRD